MANPFVTDVHFSSATNEWSTPRAFLAALAKRWGPFDLDPCATLDNATAPKFYTQGEDGLSLPWVGRVFCNPPYGRALGAWVERAATQVWEGHASRVVLLIPNRGDTRYFHEWIMRAPLVCFVEGRLSFGDSAGPAPFPSLVAVFEGEPAKVPRFVAMDRHGRIGHRKICASCDEPFRAGRSDAIYCGTPCRVMAFRRRCQRGRATGQHRLALSTPLLVPDGDQLPLFKAASGDPEGGRSPLSDPGPSEGPDLVGRAAESASETFPAPETS